MKVLFIYPDIVPSIPGYRGSLSFGLVSISAVLKEMGVQVSLLHITDRKYDRDEFIERVNQESCDLIAFSANSSMFHYAAKFAMWIKDSYKNMPIICGGIHPTIAPEEAIGNEWIDMICLGEGELVMAELCEAMMRDKDIRNIKNLWLKHKGEMCRNELRPLIKDLDSLPYYDWSLFNLKVLHESPEGVGNYLASRGCPFGCSYCANHQIRNLYKHDRNYIRFQSVDRVISEIKILLKNYPFIKYLVFQDDILAKDKRWFSKFAEVYRKEIGIPYMCNARPELINETVAQLMKLSGCSRAWLGIESGNEMIRKKILKRNISQEQLKKAFAILHSYGISTQSFNMVGLPYEDPKKVLETIKINAEINPTGMQATLFYPYPNSEIYELCKREGFLDSITADDYHTRSVLKLPTISRAQIEFYKRWLYKPLFRHPSNLKNKLIRALDFILTSNIFPYKFMTLAYQIPLYPVKYFHAKYFQKIYKRRARQFR